MVHLPQTIFFCKIINTILIYLLAPIIVQIFKKFFQRIQSYQDMQFLRPKWPISPNENFFRKPVNEPCFFHSCLSTCQKSKSDINLLVKYWRLKNTEISLAESHFSQACSFRRMLMNHKNFHSTQIPDKTNDAIFLSPKTMFLGHFWPFLVILPDGDFFLKIWLCHTQLYMGP